MIGHLGATDQLLDSMPKLWPNQRKIISIDRVPPMEANLREEEVLVAPNTDFNPNAAAAGLATPLPSEPETTASENSADSSPTPANARPKPATIDDQVRELVELEAEWGGGFFRRLRELRRLSIEEVANLTKISKTYLSAIEAETFEKLPAPVFVRGFVTQLCRTLKIPPEKAAPGYMTRFLQARPEQK